MGCWSTFTSWWFQIFFTFHPDPWGNDQIWRAYFSDERWNHQLVCECSEKGIYGTSMCLYIVYAYVFCYETVYSMYKWAGGRISMWIVYPFFTNMFIQACVALCIPYLVSFTYSSSWNLHLHPASCSTISAPCGGVPSCHLGENMWQVEDHHHRLPPSLLGSLARWRCRVLLRVHVGRGDQGITQWGNRRWLGLEKLWVLWIWTWKWGSDPETVVNSDGA